MVALLPDITDPIVKFYRMEIIKSVEEFHRFGFDNYIVTVFPPYESLSYTMVKEFKQLIEEVIDIEYSQRLVMHTELVICDHLSRRKQE